MSDTLTLVAEARERAGKGASRALRRSGRVPAVIYGHRQDARGIHIEEKLLVRHLQTGHFMNSVVMIELDGRTERTLPRDVQLHPVSDRPIHVDFLRVAADTRVTVAVPVRFVDEEASPGLKRGGVLNIVSHELEVVCPADSIPDEFVVSVSGLEVLDTVHVANIELPAGVQVAGDPEATIATIVAPSALRAEEAEADAAAAAEPAAG